MSPSTLAEPGEPVLRVQDLEVEVFTRTGWVRLVDGVSFEVDEGECLAVVGETGAGKSITFLALLGLIDDPFVLRGEASLSGRSLVDASSKEVASIRGGEVGYIFQDPTTSLNPVRTIGAQLIETIRRHSDLGRDASRRRAIELLEVVELPEPERLLSQYPHQLSGGMRQRVLIATALAPEPRLIIADECTTALDVSVQGQIIDLMSRLQRERNLSLVWISHDLGVVAQIAHRVAVLYGGTVLERGSTSQVLHRPAHRYTKDLLGCVPGLRPFRSIDDLAFIPGAPPAPTSRPRGCLYWDRCADRGDDRCRTERPPLREVAPGHFVADFYAGS